MLHKSFVKYLSAASVMLFMAVSAQARAGLRPGSLTCENVVDPSVIESVSPRLSWIDEAVGRKSQGQVQTAYQIRVASSSKRLRKADLWDSGKVLGDASYLVRYQGADLQSGQDCWWQVRVWDADGKVSRWSSPARWSMGLLNESDWSASWIGAPWQGEEARKFTEGRAFVPAPLLRRSFTVDKKVVSAKAYVTGLGLYQFFMNGQRVGEDELTPAETLYGYRPDLDKKGIPVGDDTFREYRVMYECYDILPLLKKGENVAGAMLGNGFYDGVIHWIEPYGSCRFFGQIVIEYKDGTKDVIASDESWMAHRGPIVQNDMYDGEVYDARMEVDGWCTPGAALDSEWAPAALRKAPEGILHADQYTRDHVMEVLQPKSITKLEDGSYEVDFGDYITGWTHLRHMTGSAGDTVSINHLCESRGNGPCMYILNGKGNEQYAPRFTWFAFDKVIVSGYPGELKASDITAEAVYADVRTTGSFQCSNELFNRINHIWWRSQTDNMHMGVATDCPHREKGPYTGDGQVACVTVMHNFDAKAFYTKWLQDMDGCQDVNTGYVPNGAPWHPGCGGGVGWGSAMNIIPWEYYVHYGDKDLLQKHYYAMTEQMRWMTNWIREDGTLHQQAPLGAEPIYWMNLGDWLPPYELPKDDMVHTFMLWKCADYTSRAAHVLGLPEDEARYREMADAAAEAFHTVYYDEETASYGDYGGNLMALKIGVPAERRDAVIETLKGEIASHGGHLNTGITGTQLFFEVLAENGLNELAYEAMNKKDFPSFGWWLEQGAYTTWENWDGKDSRNHPMFGGALTWFYRKVAGMCADESQPGYKHIIFKPMPCGDLTWAEYHTVTPYGNAGIRWDIDGSDFVMSVTVPVGSTATVFVPSADGYRQETVASGAYTFHGTI